MCGLTAFVSSAEKNGKYSDLEAFVRLSVFAKERGHDTAGVFLLMKRVKDGEIIARIIKSDSTINSIFSNTAFQEISQSLRSKRFCLLLAVSHTRMATIGDTSNPSENQPLVDGAGNILFYNGIVTSNRNIHKSYYAESFRNDGWKYADIDLLTIEDNDGIANIIRYNKYSGIFEWFTNNGDLFTSECSRGFFLSSDGRYLAKTKKLLPKLQLTIIKQVQNNVVSQLTFPSPSIVYPNDLKVARNIVMSGKQMVLDNMLWDDLCSVLEAKMSSVPRCHLCGYPTVESPGKNLVCASCSLKSGPSRLRFQPTDFDQLIYQASKQQQPVLLGLSGGRDSCYVLSQLVETWKLKNVVTYTFDWGVNTPYARTNVSAICAKYKVRNILIAADIRKKRANVRKVLKAYCSNPVPALVPLLMAGDKQFISSARSLADALKSTIEIFGFNPFEKTRFKEELVWPGLWPLDDSGMYGEDLSLIGQTKLLTGYSSKLLTNPSYISGALFDAARGFLNYYNSGVVRTNYFDYFEWNESVVLDKLDEIGWHYQYGRSSWRIGDGTSAFYNLAYCLHQGWCENDTLRANQVRAGQLSLTESLEKVKADNIPNREMLEWYFSILNLDPNLHLRKLLKTYLK